MLVNIFCISDSQSGRIFPPGEHLAMFGDIFGIPQLEMGKWREVSLTTRGNRLRMRPKPTVHQKASRNNGVSELKCH